MGTGLTSGLLTMSQLQQLELEALRWETADATPAMISTCLQALAQARQDLQSGSNGSAQDIAKLINILNGRSETATDPLFQKSASEVAQMHLRDASDARRAARSFAVGAGVSSLIAVAGGVWGVILASQQSKNSQWALFFPGLLVLGAFTALFLLLRGARQSMVAAREQTRIARAIVGLPSYLAPLPEPARHFMRAKLAPVIFARLIEDDDPTRNVQWPADEDILRTISGYAGDDEPEVGPTDPVDE